MGGKPGIMVAMRQSPQLQRAQVEDSVLGFMFFYDCLEILHPRLSLNLCFVMIQCNTHTGDAPGSSPRVDGSGPAQSTGTQQLAQTFRARLRAAQPSQGCGQDRIWVHRWWERWQQEWQPQICKFKEMSEETLK